MSVFRPDDEQALRDLLARLERPVELVVTLGPPAEAPVTLVGTRQLDPPAEARRVAEGLAALAPLVEATVVETDEPGLWPALDVRPEGRDAGVRYAGVPWGYELASVVGAVVAAGKAESELAPASLAALAGLDRDLALEVFVTPT